MPPEDRAARRPRRPRRARRPADGPPPAGSPPPTGTALDQTADDTDRAWGEGAEDRERDRWLQEQRPPHWG
jgi:hypothetical protein